MAVFVVFFFVVVVLFQVKPERQITKFGVKLIIFGGLFLTFCAVGPGQPSAGGPRMDRRAVTSSGVVQISRLASRLRRSAQGGPDMSF